MTKDNSVTLKPDYAVIPGETVRESLAALRMSQADLARSMARPLKTINEIIKGKASITADTAIQLEKVIGPSAAFWMNLERQYQETVARIRAEKEMRGQLPLLRHIPYKELTVAGYVPETNDSHERVAALLKFFAISDLRNIRSIAPAAYRKCRSKKAAPEALAAWLRIGEIEASQRVLGSYDASKFREALRDIRGMTRLRAQEFQPKLVTLCAASGVAVVFHPQLSKTYANGATKWLAPDRALLQLSIRGCYADRLWFSFFHEAAHLLIHGKSLSFIECEGNNDTYEAEADRFAAEWLIPERAYREFRDTGSFGVNEVCKFSERLRIHTGIVVGRLEHEGLIRYGSLNRLKTILTWANT